MSGGFRGAARRKSAAEKNAQRDDIDEAMGEGGGDEEEDGESEDDNEDGHGSGGVAKRPGTQRRKLRSFYFRTGAVVRTTADNGRDVTGQRQVGGHVDCKKILMWWKQHCVGLVQTDLRGSLLDTTMIDLMWAKQAP